MVLTVTSLFPHTGYAMPDSAQRRDADILKYELGLNLVRTSHYPQAPAFWIVVMR